MITYEQALETARAYDPSYDHVIDYEHAYEFCWEAPKREMGPHPVFVAKESGELRTMMDGSPTSSTLTTLPGQQPSSASAVKSKLAAMLLFLLNLQSPTG